jgi:glycosyltransferase involved in cell wall biosynthesis
MKFSIVTPSFRNSQWLKLCVASVADQQGVEVEHIVQDSCSDDATRDWLPKDPRVKAFIEKDTGMYDGINRGLRRASGEIMAQLNCDEEYLPGALREVAAVFERAPDVDIVFADTIVVDAEHKFVCCRKSLVPWRLLSWTYLPTLTSAIFFRRRVLDDFNLYFDVRWRIIGDTQWLKDALQLRLKMALLRRYTSVFVETGDNLFLNPKAMRERQRGARMTPTWARWFRWPLLQTHRARAVFNRLYWEKPFTYSPYTLASPDKRVDIFVPKPTGIWWNRHADAKVLKPL